MTEKRFTMVYGKYIDNENNIEYDEKWESWKICELLNEQHDRIKWLEERVSQLECLLELDRLHKEVEDGKMDKFIEWRCE